MTSSIIIRKERKEDFDEVSKLLIRAFNQDDESRLVSLLRKSNAFIPDLSMVAELEQNIVGSIIYSKIKIINDDGKEFQSIALAPMAVDPKFQKSGIGSKLITTTIDIARDLGYDSIIVLGHAGYYPKFGFVEARSFDIKAPFPVPSEAFMLLELNDGALAEISGTVEYNKAFAML